MRGGHSLVGFREGSWEASLCLRQQRSLSQCRLLSSSLCCEHSWGWGKEIQSQNSLGKRLLDLVYACESQRFQTRVEICKCVPCGFELCGRIGPWKRDAFTYLCLTALPAACERSYPGPLVVLVAEVTPNLYWMYLNFKLSSWTSPSGSHCCVLHWKRDSFPKTQAVRPFSMTLVARALVISYLGSKFTVCLFTSCLDCPSWGTVFMPWSSCWSSVHSSWWTDHWQEHKVPLVICLGSARHCIATIF